MGISEAMMGHATNDELVRALEYDDSPVVRLLCDRLHDLDAADHWTADDEIGRLEEEVEARRRILTIRLSSQV